jgi:hypothetical protein
VSRSLGRDDRRERYPDSIALLANRFDVMWAMSQVGHADSKMTTDVYAQLQQRARRDHGRAFDALVAAPESISTAPERPRFGHGPGHEPSTWHVGARLALHARVTNCSITSAVARWRDPDSNRGHHDFQDFARRSLTRRNPCSGAGFRTWRAIASILAISGFFGSDRVLMPRRVPKRATALAHGLHSRRVPGLLLRADRRVRPSAVKGASTVSGRKRDSAPMAPTLDSSFPTVVLDPTAGQWWRIHGAAHGAWFFASSDATGRAPASVGRLDLPLPNGTCYVGEYLAGTATESLRETGVSHSESQVAANTRRLSQMPLDRWYGKPIADFTSAAVKHHAAPTDIAALPRADARPWAEAAPGPRASTGSSTALGRTR